MLSNATGVIITTMKLKIQFALIARQSDRILGWLESVDEFLPCRQCICRCTNSQRHNLCRVQPRHSKPANRKEGVEHEKENCLPNTGLAIVQYSQTVVGSCKDSHRQRHAGSLVCKASSAKKITSQGSDVYHTPKSMSGRRPAFSIMKIGMNAAIRYSVPLHAASSFGKLPFARPISA